MNSSHHRPPWVSKVVKSVRLDGMTVARKIHAPLVRLDEHVHDDAKILFVLSGAFTEKVGANEFTCDRGSVLLRGPGVPHANDYGPRGADCLIVSVAPDRVASDTTIATAFARPAAFRGIVADHARRIHEELTFYDDDAARLAMEGLALELLAAVRRLNGNRTTRVAPKCIQLARDVLLAQYATPINISDVAASVGVHPVYLARAFRSYFKCSPGEFVRRLRLDEAKRRLIETRQSLAEIALLSGFASQSHFSTSFRKSTGQTPKSYRASFGWTVFQES
jgi:AraC family transcriptional regulator